MDRSMHIFIRNNFQPPLLISTDRSGKHSEQIPDACWRLTAPPLKRNGTGRYDKQESEEEITITIQIPKRKAAAG